MMLNTSYGNLSTTINFSEFKIGKWGEPGSVSAFFPRSMVIGDLDGDGLNEAVVSVTTYPTQARIPLIVLGGAGTLDVTSKFFPDRPPSVLHSAYLLLADFSGDGKKDFLASEAGLDVPPWTGAKIAVAVNTGGQFDDVTKAIPDTPTTTTSRSYALVVGDFDADGHAEILLPSQDSTDLPSVLLQYGSDGKFLVKPNPVVEWARMGLNSQSSMQAIDMNGDGYDDLVVGGGLASYTNTIVYGSKKGLNAESVNVLPPGPYGQRMFEGGYPPTTIRSGADVTSLVLDFNLDGRPDIFSISENVVYYPPNTVRDKNLPDFADLLEKGGTSYGGSSAYSTLQSIDGHKFQQTIPVNSELGQRFYFNATPFDLNVDGNMDVLGHYWTKATAEQAFWQSWGTTFFMNDGKGHFSKTEGLEIFKDLGVVRYKGLPDEIGIIVPVKITADTFVGLQITPSAYQDGQLFVQQFSTIGLNLPARSMTIADRGGQSEIHTRDQNDIIFDTGAAKSTRIDGGAGIDTCVYAGARADYRVSLGADGHYELLTKEGSRDVLLGIERLKFSDANLALDISGTAGMAYRLYEAAFNRSPDRGGLGFQMKALEDGLNIAQVAANFIASPEFNGTYGSLNDIQFVSQLYRNVLDRDPDAAGLSFHVSNLTTGTNSRANVLVGFSESPENQAALIGVMEQGMAYTT